MRLPLPVSPDGGWVGAAAADDAWLSLDDRLSGEVVRLFTDLQFDIASKTATVTATHGDTTLYYSYRIVAGQVFLDLEKPLGFGSGLTMLRALGDELDEFILDAVSVDSPRGSVKITPVDDPNRAACLAGNAVLILGLLAPPDPA